MGPETRNCQSCKNQFVIEPEDFDFYKKISVPPPTWCPECRMLRRVAFWNYRKIFRRTESLDGKDVFSWFHPNVPLTVYERDHWWSDKWDPMSYGKEYDFGRTFFEQFHELMTAVPWPARSAISIQDSDYVNNCNDARNSYLCFTGSFIENSAYDVLFDNVKEGLDLIESRHSELCYDSYMVDEVYRVFFSVNVEDSSDIWFSRNLIGCNNCFGCVNLRNKSYHIFNKAYSKEAYREELVKFESASHDAIQKQKKKAYAFWLANPMRFTLAINNMNSTGEHIEHSKNVHEGYSVHEAENLKYCQFLERATDSYDHTRVGKPSSLVYEGIVVGLEAERVNFSGYAFSGASDVTYSLYVPGSANVFGCVGLQKKRYCIFNKQYSKEDYSKLREKIIAHMNQVPYTDKQGRVYKYGEFFPPEFSPFAYNETIAQDFFPLTKEQAEAKGYLWREPDTKEFKTTLKAANLPDNIKDVKNDIIKEVIACENCGKAYRIIQMELDFYRRIPLPLPHKCPECRFKDRFKFVNPPKFWPGRCMCNAQTTYQNTTKHFHDTIPTPASAGSEPRPERRGCPNEFETSYAPGRPEIIYCENCYNAEVV